MLFNTSLQRECKIFNKNTNIHCKEKYTPTIHVSLLKYIVIIKRNIRSHFVSFQFSAISNHCKRHPHFLRPTPFFSAQTNFKLNVICSFLLKVRIRLFLLRITPSCGHRNKPHFSTALTWIRDANWCLHRKLFKSWAIRGPRTSNKYRNDVEILGIRTCSVNKVNLACFYWKMVWNDAEWEKNARTGFPVLY